MAPEVRALLRSALQRKPVGAAGCTLCKLTDPVPAAVAHQVHGLNEEQVHEFTEHYDLFINESGTSDAVRRGAARSWCGRGAARPMRLVDRVVHHAPSLSRLTDDDILARSQGASPAIILALSCAPLA